MNTTNTTKDLEYYLGLPYEIILRTNADGCVIARIEELDGCISDGETPVEALANLKAMQTAWIESCLESGTPIPEPQDEDILPSGKWVQRVSRSLHLRLTKMARKEKVSLNALVANMLSDASTAKILGERFDERVAALCSAPVPHAASLSHPYGSAVVAVVDHYNQIQQWLPPTCGPSPSLLSINRIRKLVAPETTGKIKDDDKKKDPHNFYAPCR